MYRRKLLPHILLHEELALSVVCMLYTKLFACFTPVEVLQRGFCFFGLQGIIKAIWH